MIFRVRGRDVCSVYVAASVIRIRLLCHDTEVMVVRATSADVFLCRGCSSARKVGSVFVAVDVVGVRFKCLGVVAWGS